MLTFEEFFKKKSINLQQLQQAEPVLFAEFSRDYPLMGEKSFDYTKKYWFNNLRRTYPLATEVKAHAVKAEDISEMAIQGIAVAAAQNLDQMLERPKFKEDNLSELVEKNVPEQDVSLAEAEKTIIETKAEIPVTKPAFKPRFNPKTTNKPETEIKAEPETENPQTTINPQTEPAKPAFKPRFNMQNIKKDVVKTASEPETENPKPTTEEPKPAYKPRFQMKNMPKPATENPPPASE